MALSTEMQVSRHRLSNFALGGLAALALWALADNWDNPALSAPLYLAVFSFIASYFSVALALAGPIPMPKALTGALLIALPVTILVSLAGMRQVIATDLLDEPVMLSVIFVLVFFSTPFLLVWLDRPQNWRRYAALFDTTWSMVVRYGLAYVFVGVFWLVTFLSNALLRLVGVDIIERLLRTEWAPFALSGAMLGLGLAVVYELRTRISPLLVLRLLRLLVPVVLAVLVVFLAAIPLRGLSNLFGEFSAAGILMGAAIVAITLISTALDRDETRAVHTRDLRIATMILAVLLPLLSALAVWAVVLRVRQYGWTPDRVLAICAALFVLAYGVGYSIAVLRGSGWGARVRNVNVAMALAVIGVSALWLTPVLDPYRISTRNQVSRFMVGRSDLDQLPLWSMQHDWGRAGQNGLSQLETLPNLPDREALLTRITEVRTQTSRYKFQQAVEARQQPGNAAELARLMPVRPTGATPRVDMFADLPFYRLTQWLGGCNRMLPDGRPGCVFVRGPFRPGLPPDAQGMILYLDGTGRVQANHVAFSDSGETQVSDVLDPVAGRWSNLPKDALIRVLDGDFDILPSGTNALFIGDTILVPGN